MIQPNVAISAAAMTAVSSHDIRISLLQRPDRACRAFSRRSVSSAQPRRNAPGISRSTNL